MSDSISDHPQWSTNEYVLSVITCLVVPFIIVGNLFVIISVIKFRRLQVPTNYLVLSLAISDLSNGLFLPFLVAVEVKKEAIKNIHVCLVPYSIILTSASISIMTLAAIAYDRYTACVNPLVYAKVVSIRRIIVMIISIWFLGIVLPWGVIFGLHHRNEKQHLTLYCSFSWIPRLALAILLAIIFLPCCLFIFFCYFRIYLIARHHARAIENLERAVHINLQMRYFKKDTRYAKTLGIVIGGFLILTLPFQISVLIEVAFNMSLNVWIVNYMILLAVLNNGINPWVYAFRNGEFKAAFKRLLQKTPFKLPSKDHNSTTNVSVINLSRMNSRMNSHIHPDMMNMLCTNLERSNMVSLSAAPKHNTPTKSGVKFPPNASLHKIVTVKSMLKASGLPIGFPVASEQNNLCLSSPCLSDTVKTKSHQNVRRTTSSDTRCNSAPFPFQSDLK